MTRPFEHRGDLVNFVKEIRGYLNLTDAVDAMIDCLQWQAGEPLPTPTSKFVSLEDVLEVIQAWFNAYPLDVFPPEGTSKDCTAAAMGRHMATRLKEEMNELPFMAVPASAVSPSSENESTTTKP